VNFKALSLSLTRARLAELILNGLHPMSKGKELEPSVFADADGRNSPFEGEFLERLHMNAEMLRCSSAVSNGSKAAVIKQPSSFLVRAGTTAGAGAVGDGPACLAAMKAGGVQPTPSA
jgi:hypothetical protein